MDELLEESCRKTFAEKPPANLHQEAQEISVQLITVTSAISKLYDIKATLTARLERLSKGLNPGDSLKAILPLIENPGELEWREPVL